MFVVTVEVLIDMVDQRAARGLVMDLMTGAMMEADGPIAAYQVTGLRWAALDELSAIPDEDEAS